MSDYYEKYLKYKNKYIELKNIMGSGNKYRPKPIDKSFQHRKGKSIRVLNAEAARQKQKNAENEAELEHQCKNINDNIDMYPTCICRQEKLTENYNEKLKKYNESSFKFFSTPPTPPTPLPAINQENQTKLPLAVECGFLGRVEKITYK
jgi:hypothetical protein